MGKSGSLGRISSVLFKKEIWIEAMACSSYDRVETLSSSISFYWDSSFGLRICTSVATGLQRSNRTLPPCNDGSHPHYVDDVFSW